MAKERNGLKAKIRTLVFKGLKATIKGLAFYAMYSVLWIFLAPLSEIVSGFQQTVEVFIIMYITFVIVEELASGTIFKHIFNAAKALFVVCYLVFSMKDGLCGATYQNINLVIDLRLFFTIATLLSLLGFVKSTLEAINYLSERAEYTHI
ncbi:MAG: hypothetical protein HXY34_14140 [Candidatus Thorarchaeota archaeon]|nr:hypothetical protein [Candidatus Thorarchaeota archaeon]